MKKPKADSNQKCSHCSLVQMSIPTDDFKAKIEQQIRNIRNEKWKASDPK